NGERAAQSFGKVSGSANPSSREGRSCGSSPRAILNTRIPARSSTQSAASDSPRHFHRVNISLSDDGSQTRISVVQDNNTTTRELEHSEGGWRLTLNNLKALLEGTRQ